MLSLARLSLLPAFVLLLAAFGSFAAAPAQAQAVWSATLTVKEPSGNRGCYGRTGSHGCYTALDSYGFTKDSVGYDVRGLFVSTGQNNDRLLYLILDKTIPDGLKTLKLCVGTAGLVLSDGTSNNDNKGVEWSSNSFSGVPDWSVGETVAVSLASSCTQQARTPGVTLSADNSTPVEGGTVTVTATLDAAAPAGGVTLSLQALDSVSKTIYTTAAKTDDYTLSPPAISIAGGQTTGTATLAVDDDQAVEDTWYSVAGETVVLEARSASLSLVSNPLVITILDNDGPFAGRRPGQPTLEAVTSGQHAPTATTLAFNIGCASGGSDSRVTDYVLWAENVKDETEHYSRTVSAPDRQCVTFDPVTLTGLPSRTAETTYRVRVFARNIFGFRSPWSDHVEIATLANNNSVTSYDPNADFQGPGVEVSATELDMAVGDTVGYTVKLQSPPIDIVVISPTVADGGKASVSPSELHFDENNWNVAQDVTVRGLAAGATAVRHTIQTVDPIYGGTLAPDVAVTVGAAGLGGTLNGDGRLANPYAALIAKVREWRNDPRHSGNKGHTDRWDRVLLALGETVPDASLTPMGAAEAQGYADRGWTRWVEVAAALRQIENGGAQPPVPVPAVSIAAGAPVTEGAPASFTLTAMPAPAADLGVSVEVSQNSAFTDPSALGVRTVTIPAGQSSATFAVATVDDAADEPDGSVTAALASGSGYTLGDAASATVAVADDDEPPPNILTRRTIAREGRDAAAVFTVRLDRPAPKAVTVDYATADGAGSWAGTAPATAGADYTATSGTLSFAAGQTTRTVPVPILDDAIDEGTEHFLLRFSNPEGAILAAEHRETQGLIRNDDHLQSAWLSRFGRTVGSQMTDAVSARLEGGLAPGAHATLAGRSVDVSGAEGGKPMTDVLTALAMAWGPREAEGEGPVARGADGLLAEAPAATLAARSLTGREILLGSSFHVAPEGGHGPAAWGRVSRGGFDGVQVDGTGRTTLGGTVTTATLGADVTRGRLLAGLAVSFSDGEGAFESPDADTGGSGRIESRMTTAAPYARLRLGQRVTAWGLVGRGTGDMAITFGDGRAPVRAGLSMRMGALGVRGALLRQDAGGGMDLALKADALHVRTDSGAVPDSAATSADASRLRLLLEGSRSFAVSETGSFRPSVEIGLRQDGGDAETGFGIEAGGGVRFEDSGTGLSLSLDGRALALHEDRDLKDWGLAVSMSWDPRPETRLGPSVIATRGWGGAPTGGVAALLESEAIPGTDDAAGGEAGSLGLEMAWGTDLSGWRHGMTGSAYGRLSGSPDAEDLRLGWRVAPDLRFPESLNHDFWLEPGTGAEAAAGAGLSWSSERRHVRSSTGIDLGAREGGGLEAGFRLTRER
ncbi:MAG: hypothetical protein OXH79_12165 [Boseongicola sp.]|nr:hypothetical protein [Boseongicola sp.]